MTATITVGLDALINPDVRDATAENPIWDPPSRTWVRIDQPAGAIRCFDPETGRTTSWDVGEVVGSMVLRTDGGAVCACESGVFDADLPDGGGAAITTRLATATHPKPGMRFNDGRCDRQGRYWFSSMVKDIAAGDPAGRLHRFTRDGGLVDYGDGGIIVPNGSAFSPDGRIFYSSDSHRSARVVWAYDYDIDDGMPHNRRVFIDMKGMVGRPDGAAVDAAGCYWICCIDEGCVKRFTPEGTLDLRIEVPMRKPTMCAFGGDDLRTMMVTSLTRGPEDLADDPHGGRVLLFRTEFQGLPEPRFPV